MDTRKITVWTLVVLGIVALFALLVYLGGSGRQANALTLSTPISETDHIRGPKDARLTLVEYSDFECPACAMYEPMIHEIQNLFPNDIRVVYRHFPLMGIHPKALLAAEASEAAHNQGKFWEYHDLLFDRQEQWVKSSSTEETFTSYAKELGLNTENFKTDMLSVGAKERVTIDIQSGNTNNINGTPTFFLNGNRIEITSLDQLKTLVQNALKVQ